MNNKLTHYDSDPFKEVEESLKKGNLKSARDKILTVSGKGFNSIQRSRLANLCRRLGLNKKAILLLRPIVRAEKDSVRSTPDEVVEYAACLAQVGAGKEALDLLDGLRVQGPKSQFLHRALILFKQWEYQKSIEYLEKYISLSGDDPYSQVVGKVNLAVALSASNRIDEASLLIEETLAVTKDNDFNLMHSTALLILAQCRIEKKEFEAATSVLKAAQLFIPKSQSSYHLIIEKWNLINLLHQRGDRSLIGELVKVQHRAKEASHWEVVRDCEFYRSMFEKDLDRFKKVYFGTPFHAYKQKILSEMELTSEDLGSAFFFHPPDEGSSEWTGPYIDVEAGRVKDLVLFNPGSKIHSLLVELVRDLFCPPKLETLFSQIYPGEYFNPASSTQRVAELIHRLRKQLLTNHVPLSVMAVSNGFRLQASSHDLPIRLLPDAAVSRDTYDLRIKKLLENANGQCFTAEQAATLLKISRPSVSRLLNIASDRGQIVMIRQGWQRYYKAAA